MPKHNTRSAINDRLARRTRQVDPKRLDLLGKILEESSSVALNDNSIQASARQAFESHLKLIELIQELKQVESNCNPALPERNEQSWRQFFSWFDEKNNGESNLSESLTVSLLNSTDEINLEYALITKVPFKKGSTVFNIHRRTMLSTETVAQDSDLSYFIRNDSIAMAMQNVVLVLHLLNERSKGAKSYWSPYLGILPKKILPVLTSDKNTLQQMLASSHIFDALKLIRAIARQYSYFYKRLQASNLPISKDFTYEYYCWGVSIVCSRQNEVPPAVWSTQSSIGSTACSAPKVHAIIPVLDMCNHSHCSNQASFENDYSQLIAMKDLGIGDEVTINYGCRSSGDFYIHNGFVPTEVPFDIVPLNITLNPAAPLYKQRLDLLKILNMPTCGRFRLTRNDYKNRHKRDPHLTMFLIVYLLNEDELDNILDSQNPVGIADSIYEYVQYKDYNDITTTDNLVGENVLENEGPTLSDMQLRLYKSLKEYLAKRSSIGIALINRALTNHELDDFYMSRMLEHEKSVYESHLIN